MDAILYTPIHLANFVRVLYNVSTGDDNILQLSNYPLINLSLINHILHFHQEDIYHQQNYFL